MAQNKIPFNLISYQNDGKGRMAMAAKVERACVSIGNRAYLRRRGIRATIPGQGGLGSQPPQAQPRRSHPLRQDRRRYQAAVTIAAISEWLLPEVWNTPLAPAWR
jgi:hypothetical protein